MSYRDTPAGEIRIWLDADYANYFYLYVIGAFTRMSFPVY